MEYLINGITPFMTKTTAIMSAVIILVIIGAYLVSTEKKINRQTVEKFLVIIKKSVIYLISLEAILTIINLIEYFLDIKY